MAVKALDASGILYTERRNFYLSPNMVKELWTDVAPYTTLVSNRGTEKVSDPMFKMFEHRSGWINQQVTANLQSSVTVAANGTASDPVAVDGIKGLSTTVDNSFIGLEMEVWTKNAQGEYVTRKGAVLVYDISDGKLVLKTLTASAITIADNDVLIVIGNARGEGTHSPEAWSDELDIVFNSAQIFKTPIEITGTLLEASLKGYSSELARLRVEKNKEHKMQKEKAFLFGTSVAGTNLNKSNPQTFSDTHRTDKNGKKVRTTYGLVSALNDFGISDPTAEDQTLFTINSTTFDYSDFNKMMEKVFHYVPSYGEKYAFVGPGALTYWSNLGKGNNIASKSKWTVNISDFKRDRLGFNFKFLETPHGILRLVPLPSFRGPYSKKMLIVSDENMKHVKYRPEQFQTNIKTDDGYDGVKDQYFSDEGTGVSLLESHKLVTIL